MLSFADREGSTATHSHIKMVNFDMDGVLIKGEAAWALLRGGKKAIAAYRAYLSDKLSLTEARDLYCHEMRLIGLRRDEFINAAQGVELEEHAQEVVDDLHKRGIMTGIITLAPTIFARVVASRLHPKAFLARSATVSSSQPMNVYGNTPVFDSQGYFVETFSYPTETGEPWENATDMSKRKVLDHLARKYDLEMDQMLFVSDGHDRVSPHRTVGYRHTTGTMQTVAEISDLRELLRFV